MRVAIIGGSIAGCALALLLKDAFDVTVFERSKNLKSRGAGITLSKELLDTLISKDMIDKDTISYSSSSRSFYCQSPNKPEYGQCLWRQNISVASLHWEVLFNNLRKRVPNTIYKSGCKIIEVTLNDNDPNELIFESGERQQFDLIIFADGSQSMGRKLISTNSQLVYSGYVAWRGMLDFDLIKDKAPFINNTPYFCFNTGHLLAYPVHHEGIKKLNWVFYEKLPIERLDSLGSTSQVDFSEHALAHLHQLAKTKLPQAIAQVVIDTNSPFIQKIVDVGVDKIVTNNALLLGDASVVMRPHVGNGASLAIQDALQLSELLIHHKKINEALMLWEKNILSYRISTYELSKRMADALVLNPVSWQAMDEPQMEMWWERIIRNEKWYTTLNQPFSHALLTWYDIHGRKNLPWQSPRDPYRVWISEIMLQQTQVQTVIAYFNRFMERLPTIHDLANAADDEVLSLWSGLGYYSRARNLHQTAKIICNQYQGQFPQSLDELIKLPGIGPSTAAAILAQAFNQPTAIMDGNVKRVLTRVFQIKGWPEQADVKRRLWALANSCMPNERCADYTQAIMDLGAICCTPKNPNCVNCPLQFMCLAYANEEQALYPTKRVKKPVPTHQQQFLVLCNNEGHIYLEKRPPAGLWGGLWCLPSIDVDDCPLSFIKTQYDLKGHTPQTLLNFKHKFSHFHLEINALSINVQRAGTAVKETAGRWFAKNELSSLGLAKPTSMIVEQLETAS